MHAIGCRAAKRALVLICGRLFVMSECALQPGGVPIHSSASVATTTAHQPVPLLEKLGFPWSLKSTSHGIPRVDGFRFSQPDAYVVLTCLCAVNIFHNVLYNILMYIYSGHIHLDHRSLLLSTIRSRRRRNPHRRPLNSVLVNSESRSRAVSRR